VTAEAALANEEINVEESEGGGEGVGATLAIFARAKEEEESHEAKVGNGSLDVVALVEGVEDPQEDGEQDGHYPGGGWVLASVGG